MPGLSAAPVFVVAALLLLAGHVSALVGRRIVILATKIMKLDPKTTDKNYEHFLDLTTSNKS
jgi:hypothetical protein